MDAPPKKIKLDPFSYYSPWSRLLKAAPLLLFALALGFNYVFMPKPFPYKVESCVEDTQAGRIYRIKDIGTRFFPTVRAEIVDVGFTVPGSWHIGESINFELDPHQRQVPCPGTDTIRWDPKANASSRQHY